MKVLSVVGARPQFVKLSPIDMALRNNGHEHIIVHTGQHYDSAMSDQLFKDLGIPDADINLGVGSGTHAVQTAAMLSGLEPIFQDVNPDWVLVYGDTNSTLAASVAAVKIHQKLAHLEAGLRSGNRRMPEEHNRILTDHASDLLLAPTDTAMQHLKTEGLSEKSINIGDVMTDVCWRVRDLVAQTAPLLPDSFPAAEEFILATIHRAENTDDPKRLAQLVAFLAAQPVPVALVAHPRLVAFAEKFQLNLHVGSIVVIPPMSYSQMVYVISQSIGVLTDSGGLQKEAFLLDKACVTLRQETEWLETLVGGWNTLDPDLKIDPMQLFRTEHRNTTALPFGDGHAAERAVKALESSL